MPFNLVKLIEKDVDLEEEFEQYLSKMKLRICELLREKTNPFSLVFYFVPTHKHEKPFRLFTPWPNHYDQTMHNKQIH
jgi:hypothetical protein